MIEIPVLFAIFVLFCLTRNVMLQVKYTSRSKENLLVILLSSVATAVFAGMIVEGLL